MHLTMLAGIVSLFIAPLLVSCQSAAGPEVPRPIAQSLLGKTKQDLLSCAGAPLHETTVPAGAVLTYYKEIPMLEESFVGSKGSRSTVHGGCRARLSVSDNRVMGIEYESVPPEVHAQQVCEAMFEPCVP